MNAKCRFSITILPFVTALGCSDSGEADPARVSGVEESTDNSSAQEAAVSDLDEMPSEAGDETAPVSAGEPTDESSMPELPLDTAGEATGMTDPDQGGEVTTAAGPSPGCAGGSGAEGEFQAMLPGGPADYTVALPDGYDGSTPLPLVFGFHGRGRTHLEYRNVDAGGIQTEIEPRAVVAYLKSQNGNGWNAQQEVQPNVDFFEAVYATVLDQYCVDTSRVFAIGHSSGGYFSNILACRFGDRLRGIGAVAGANQEQNCTGQVAAMVIHGVTDAVVSFASGQQSRNEYLAANGCMQASAAGVTAPCIAYEGCDAGFPVEWCEHAEPTYTDQMTGLPTNHGWPSFASRAIGQFLFSLP